MSFTKPPIHLQYKAHNLTKWMGEQVQQEYKWRGGKHPETNGIWIWSEIFTHRDWNGDDLAIVLMDTQGILDHKSSTNDCKSIFTLGMLLSSVYCFNVKNNVEEDKLQFLEFCMNYAQLAMKNSDGKVFQRLLFIVRDWQNTSDHGFGLSTEFVDDLLAEQAEQTSQMHEIRRQIRKSIDVCSAFLMPYPGKCVSQDENFQGDLTFIQQNFIKPVETLVPLILAPQHLIIKRVNGEKIRFARFATLLKTYVGLFNSDELPSPQSFLRVSRRRGDKSRLSY